MSKVLTFHNQSNGQHWFRHGKYSKREIDSIKDPERGNTEKAPTSIPSPFAQMDLVKTAFKNFNNSRDFTGTNIDFKLISHCLDIGELFFNIDTLGNQVKILAWDKVNDLNNLLRSSNPRHKKLGEALQLYLSQDEEAYNFHHFRQLFFLQIDYKIVGGTSPATLFFTSANDLSFVNVTMPNSHVLLGNQYCHLYERDEQYQLFLYALKKSMPGFGAYFKEVSEYMERCENVLRAKNTRLYGEINELTAESYQKMFDVLDAGISNNMVNILEYPLKKRKGIDGKTDSDYEIRATKSVTGKLPLALQHKHGGKATVTGEPMIYYQFPLTKEIADQIPFLAPEPNLEARNLPGLTGVKYPFTVLNDFLEPYLIQLPYPLHTDKYYSGSVLGADDQLSYLIPLKKTFFDYFTLHDLKNGTVEGGRRIFEMKKLAGGSVQVILRIPVKKDHITFERIYYVNPGDPNSPPRPEPENNKGSIIECHFGTTIFPFIKVQDPALRKHYRVLMVDRDLNYDFKMRFFQEESNEQVQVKAETSRNNKNAGYAPTAVETYVLEDDFDYIQLDNGQAVCGLIIPNFISRSQGNESFHFAIDFGTTNTHIEYKVGSSGMPRPFEITSEDVQVGTLHDPHMDERYKYLQDKLLTDLLDVPKDIFPERLGKGQHHSFPQRTVIAQSIELNFEKPTYALADFNIPFIYEKSTIPAYTKVETDLKWANYTQDNQSKRKVEAFFEKLLFMIRAKVLLNRGHLDQVKMTWFYPTSMTEARVNQLESLWNELYKKYITANNIPVKLSESIAPFYYYKDSWGVNASARPVVAIDIGGGTSDVVIYENNRPVILTSFRFAANSVFGDGFSEFGKASRNGFVLKYANSIRALFEVNQLYDLIRVFENIQDNRKSVDILAFFFSLENNKNIRDNDLPISFSRMLKDDDEMRIIFLIFFVAILYHIFSLMKAKGLPRPRYITLSGNGSKVIQYITPNNAALEQLAQVVLAKVYGKNTGEEELEIKRELDAPKEATCKGGLMMDESFSYEDIENIKTTFLGASRPIFADESLTYGRLEKDAELLQEVVSEYRKFVDLLFEVDRELRFNAKFAITLPTIALTQKILTQDILTYVKEGLLQKKKEMPDPNTPIEETLFFYPLIGSLNRLAFEIAGTGAKNNA